MILLWYTANVMFILSYDLGATLKNGNLVEMLSEQLVLADLGPHLGFAREDIV